MKMGEYTPIRHLKPGMKDLTLMFIVLDVGRPNMTKDNHEVRTVRVADKTGAINLSLWGEPGKLIQSGDIIRMTKGYTNVWKGCLTLYVGKVGEFHKVGDFCLIFSETPFMSDFNAEYAAMDPRGQGQGAAAGAPGAKGFRNNGTALPPGGGAGVAPGQQGGQMQKGLGRGYPANGGGGAGWGAQARKDKR